MVIITSQIQMGHTRAEWDGLGKVVCHSIFGTTGMNAHLADFYNPALVGFGELDKPHADPTGIVLRMHYT